MEKERVDTDPIRVALQNVVVCLCSKSMHSTLLLSSCWMTLLNVLVFQELVLQESMFENTEYQIQVTGQCWSIYHEFKWSNMMLNMAWCSFETFGDSCVRCAAEEIELSNLKLTEAWTFTVVVSRMHSLYIVYWPHCHQKYFIPLRVNCVFTFTSRTMKLYTKQKKEGTFTINFFSWKHTEIVNVLDHCWLFRYYHATQQLDGWCYQTLFFARLRFTRLQCFFDWQICFSFAVSNCHFLTVTL